MALDSSWGKTPEERRANVIAGIVTPTIVAIMIVFFCWLIVFHPKHPLMHKRIFRTPSAALPDQPVMVTGHK